MGAGNAQAVHLPGECQRKQREGRDHRPVDQHGKDIEFVGDRNEQNQPDHDTDGIDRIEYADAGIGAYGAQPVLGHQQVEIGIDRAHSKDQSDQHKQSPDRLLTNHGAQNLQRGLVLHRAFLLLNFRRFVWTDQLILTAHHQHSHHQAQRGGDHPHREYVDIR